MTSRQQTSNGNSRSNSLSSRQRGIVALLTAAALGSFLLEPLQAAAARGFAFNSGRLPEGAKMVESMCSVQVDARILLMTAAQWSHKVVTFKYPADSSHRWVWDPQSMSREVAATGDDAMAIATAWASATGVQPGPTSAEFVASETPNQCSK